MVDSKYLDPENIAAADRKYNFRPFQEAPPSKISVPTIELAAIDLSGFSYATEDFAQRKKLADELETAVSVHGFFKVVGHGIDEQQFNLMKSIGQSIFEVSQEEKDDFVAGKRKHPSESHKTLGVIRGAGFKPSGHWALGNNRRDRIECFNLRTVVHDDIYYNETEYPEYVKYHLREIQDYFKYLHLEVLRKILTLFDIILELPEGTLWETQYKVHKNEVSKSGGGFCRFILYHPVDEAYNKDTKGTWLRGHSDGCGLTIIASQPILSLQIRDHETNEWKFVSHTPNALIVNIADAFQLVTGNYFKSAIHRVAAPPIDQQSYERSTLIYFINPRDDIYLDPDQLKSPKLERKGIVRDTSLERITFSDWDEAKNQIFNDGDNTQKDDIKLLGRDTVINLVTKSYPISNI